MPAEETRRLLWQVCGAELSRRNLNVSVSRRYMPACFGFVDRNCVCVCTWTIFFVFGLRRNLQIQTSEQCDAALLGAVWKKSFLVTLVCFMFKSKGEGGEKRWSHDSVWVCMWPALRTEQEKLEEIWHFCEGIWKLCCKVKHKFPSVALPKGVIDQVPFFLFWCTIWSVAWGNAAICNKVCKKKMFMRFVSDVKKSRCAD